MCAPIYGRHLHNTIYSHHLHITIYGHHLHITIYSVVLVSIYSLSVLPKLHLNFGIPKVLLLCYRFGSDIVKLNFNAYL